MRYYYDQWCMEPRKLIPDSRDSGPFRLLLPVSGTGILYSLSGSAPITLYPFLSRLYRGTCFK